MPCYKPLQAWRTTERTRYGKSKIVFAKSANSTHSLSVPCGQCIGCRLERASVWATRCMHEAHKHDSNCFITLTYAPEHIPYPPSLVKSHFQDFIRELRRVTGEKIRYYMCGEYGDQLNRPHYHACLFGYHFNDREPFYEKEGLVLFTSEILESVWGRGYATVCDFSYETAAYTARYIAKKITGDQAKDHYQTSCEHTGEILELEPEYNNMSLKPGIGAEFLEKYKSDIYPLDETIIKGKKVKTPRYYDKLYEASGEDIERIKELRKRKARRSQKENTPERLAVREKCKILQYKKLTRGYENESQNIFDI